MGITAFFSFLITVLAFAAQAAGLPAPQYLRPTPRFSAPPTPMEMERAFDIAIEKARVQLNLPTLQREDVLLVKSTAQPYTPPKRDYTKRACYHLPKSTLGELIYCDAERCLFTDLETNETRSKVYCEHKTRRCYTEDGTLLIDEHGNSVRDTHANTWPKEQWCLTSEGVLIPEDGGPPYEDRFKAGCVYRIVHPDYTRNTDFIITCDQYRCLFPRGGSYFDLITKEYVTLMSTEAAKTELVREYTPSFEDFLSINWQCLDMKKVKGFDAKFNCDNVWQEDAVVRQQCQVCYEKGKHVYKQCVYTYDERGERTGRRLPAYNQAMEDVVSMLDRLRGEYIYKDRLLADRFSTLMFEKLFPTPLDAESQVTIAAAFDQFFAAIKKAPLSRKTVLPALNKLEKNIYPLLKKLKNK